MHLSIEFPAPPPPPPALGWGFVGELTQKISPRGGAFVKMADNEKNVLVCLGKHKRAVSFTTPPDGYKSPPNPHP